MQRMEEQMTEMGENGMVEWICSREQEGVGLQ